MPAALRGSALTVWFAGWLVGTAAAATSIVSTDLPGRTGVAGAALLTVVFAAGLTRRCGGRVWLWTTLAAIVSSGAVFAEQRWLLAGTSVLVAVLAGILAVMATRPADSVVGATGEFVLAVVLAATGAVAVAGWDAPIDSSRYNLLVDGVSLLLTLGLVWRLGAGLHGMGRRGCLVVVAGAALIALVLVYGQVLRTYGSKSIVDTVNSTVAWFDHHLHGVPRPAEVLIGFPALVWGISTRASRRQGWWMCAFGVVGTATVATSLAAPRLDPVYAGLSTLYSVVLGLALGLVVHKVDTMLTGSGSRALRGRGDAELRPEPGRTEPLR